MKLLLDTHLLLWSGKEPDRISERARELIADLANELFFSAVSIWEIAIKQSLQKPGFEIPARTVRERLLRSGYREVALTGVHGIAVESLPLLHGDPFDRILIAQAVTEAITLLTSDGRVAQYPGPILKV